MKREFPVGIDSYTLTPLGLTPLETLDWAAAHGADGVQFSGGELPDELGDERSYLRDFAHHARTNGLYLEWGGGQHIPFDMETWEPRDIAPINGRAAEQAAILGATVIRSCSGGLMRWTDRAPPTDTLLRATARCIAPQMALLADHGVTLAIELHFEFTTFELLRLFDMCGAQPGGNLGICLDTMNLLTMLEDPVEATKRILPWVVATHVKDGGLLLEDEGLCSFPCAVGKGLVDFPAIFDLLSSLGRTINLSLEDHGGSFALPIFDSEFLRRFPDLSAGELVRLLGLARATQRRVDDRSLAPLDRADWPRHCESRAINGIEGIRRIVQSLPDKPAKRS